MDCTIEGVHRSEVGRCACTKETFSLEYEVIIKG
jgi:hypothetical protein